MNDKLRKELEARRTAEISNGEVNQVTQAIDESPDSITFLMFGEMQKVNIMPIEKACAKCWPNKSNKSHKFFHNDVKECQALQKKDGESRGFHKLICPQQIINE